METNFVARARESSTPLAANGVAAGATYDGYADPAVTASGVQGGEGFSKFRALAAADAAGTLNVQQSPDGTHWFTTATQAVPAGFGSATVVESLWVLRYARASFTNGAAGQTQFEFDTAAVAV